MGVYLFFTGLIIVILFAAIGFFIKFKKAYWLISGYNTMSAEKKKNVDTEGLGSFMGNALFIMSAIFFISSVLALFGKMAACGIVFAFILPMVVYIIIKAQKYDGNTRNAVGKMKTGTKLMIASIIAVLVITTAGVGVLMYFSAKPTEYVLQNGILKISGMYGGEIPVDEINSMELKDTLPQILLRTNGSALGTKLKGHFKLKDVSDAKLFIDTSKPPFIFLKINSKLIILNCDDSLKTEELYKNLENSVKK
jgi:hypothetical protein